MMTWKGDSLQNDLEENAHRAYDEITTMWSSLPPLLLSKMELLNYTFPDATTYPDIYFFQ